jgi:hypothetical protein
VTAAHQTLDESLSGIRDQQEQARRAQASLQQTITSAQAQISATSDYITGRGPAEPGLRALHLPQRPRDRTAVRAAGLRPCGPGCAAGTVRR